MSFLALMNCMEVATMWQLKVVGFKKVCKRISIVIVHYPEKTKIDRKKKMFPLTRRLRKEIRTKVTKN
jgi:hypothetical protein